MSVITLGSILVTQAPLLAANNSQSLAAIESAALDFAKREFVQPGTDYAAQSLDSRLQLRACDGPLVVRPGPGAGLNASRMTVRVACESSVRWKVYVALAMTRKVPTVVAERGLQPGEILTDADITVRIVDSTHLTAGYFSSIEELVGREVKHAIRVGELLRPVSIQSAQLISRGQTLDIISRQSGIQVRMRGSALQAGREGQRIRVKNQSSGRILEARVFSASQVIVDRF